MPISREQAPHLSVIDAHSHLGLNILHLGNVDAIEYFDCPSDLYVEKAQELGVTHSAVSYAPCPEYSDNNGKIVRPCFWLFEDGKVNYYREEIDPHTHKVVRTSSKANPYIDVNQKLLQELNELNSDSKINFFALGLVHPLLDTKKEIQALLANDLVVGLKLHGLATHTGPQDIPDFVPETLKAYDKAIVVHTDIMRDTNVYPVMRDLYNANHPKLWLNWAIAHGVKIFLTHGARLDRETIQKATEHSGKVLIGTSPDLLLQNEQSKLAIDTSYFLKTLVQMCPHALLAFDIDFAWNIIDREDWDKKDWAMVERHRDLIVDKQKLKDVLSENSRRFYQL